MANCLNVSPSFNSSRTSICGVGPHLVSFTNTSTGINSASSGYQWYLNGVQFANTTGTLGTTFSTITAVGSYDFMMVSYDTLSLCTDTAFHTVIITQKPTANFSFPTGTICPNSVVPFTNSSSGGVAGVKYFWDFGDGGVDSSVNPTHIYGGGGTYNVSLTIINSDSCSDTISQNITLLNTPNINVSGDDGDGNIFRCLNAIDTVSQELVSFFNNSAPGVTYTWDFGDGSPLVTQTYATGPDTITHLFTSYGTFPVVCYTIDSNGCKATDTLFVVFDKFISASFSVPLANISGCAPHLVTPTNNSINANRYEWDFGDGSPIIFTATMAPPVYVYDSTGVYYITLRAINDCGFSVSTVGPITVSKSPDVDFTTSLFTRGCSPQNVSVFDASQFVFPINNFKWDMGNGNVYNGVNPPVQNYNTGVYTIKFVGSNGCGSDSMFQTIRIDSLPYAQVSVSPTSGCSGMTVDGSAVNFGFGTLSRWYVDSVQVGFGDTLPTQTFTNFSTAIQTHTIRYNIRNHCGSYDSTIIIEVHPEVQAILDTTINPICSKDSILHQSISNGDSLSYLWRFGDGTSSTLAGPHWKTYSKKGVDSISLFLTGYCGVDSIKKIILIDSLPYASITVSPIEGCSPLVVNGSAVPFGNGTTSTWYRNGGFYWSGDTMPVTTFTNNSNAFVNRTLRYTLTNHCGSFDTITTIKVHPAVLARMTPVNGSVCEGDSLQFRNVSNGDSLKFLWRFSNGDTTSVSGPHYRTFNVPGLDTTWLFVDGYCGKDSVFSVTTVNKIPVANIIADVDSGCEDLSVNLTNGAPNGANYLWNINGGFPFLSFSYNSSVLFTTPGSNQVFLTVDSMGCSARDTTNIVVFPGPDPSFTYTPLDGCSDLSVAITNTSPVSFGDKYLWNFGNGISDTLYSPSDQVFVNTSNLTDTVYPVKLIIYTANGCNDSLTQLVTVHPLPNSLFTVSDTFACEKEVLSFQNNSVGGNNYKWYFGDGDSSFLSSPIHSYDTAGTYIVTLISNTIWNCKDTSYQTIVINPNPIARFFFDSVCFSYATSFADSSLFGPISWKWAFGDGDSSSVQNPTHLYLKDSVYSVSLLVSNVFACKDSISNSVIVYDRPVANFGNSTACAKKQTFFFDSSSANPTKWMWDFGDGFTDTVKSPGHIYAVGGVYPVRLIVENSSGCIDTIVKMVTISTVPQTHFVANSVCLGTATNFIDSTVLGYAATSYFWNFGDGNFSGLQNPSYQYLSAGGYLVSLTVTNINGCDSTFLDSVFVYTNPVSTFVHDTVCAGAGTHFVRAISPNNPVYYIWNYGDGSGLDTNSSPNFYYTYAADGAYLVSLTVVNASGCADSTSQTIIVHPKPVAQFSPQNDTICLGDSAAFLNNSIGANSYQWLFGDGNTSNTINPLHSYSLTGNYQVSLFVQNANGCSDTIIDSVTVFDKPVARFVFDTVCENLSTSFTNLSSGGAFISIWNYGDGSPLDTNNNINISHLYANDGVFLVKLLLLNPSGCIDSLSKTVIVYPKPVAGFVPQDDTICLGDSITFLNSSLNANTYQWLFGDGNISNAITPSHLYSLVGGYQINLFVENTQGCSDTVIDSVTVFDKPVATFIFDTVCENLSTSFTNLSSGGFFTSVWDYGDGSPLDTNNSAVISHLYSSDGVYLVKLLLLNPSGCIDSVSQAVVVYPLVLASFSPQNDSICLRDSITFLNSSLGATSYQWSFGDGNTSSAVNPVHFYSLSGVYQINLVVQNPQGCSDTIIDSAFVLVNPIANYLIDTVCFGTPSSFTNLSSGTGLKWFWSFGDGNFDSTQSPNYIYGSDTSFNTTLIVETPFGCSDTLTKIAVVLPIVDAHFNNSLACVGRVITFTDSSAGVPNNWFWSFGDGNTSTIQNPTHSYNATGNYTVSLIVINSAGCNDTISKVIFVNSIPVPNFTADTICVGNIMSFNNLTTNAQPITSYFWSFGDGNNSYSINPTYTYASSGVYIVTLTVTNNGGCDSSISIPVVVNANPVANFTHDTVCVGLATTFTDISSGFPISWKWNFGDFSPIDSTTGPVVSHSYTTAGLYTASLEIKSGSNGCGDQVIKYVTVLGGVTASFSVATPVCEGAAVQFVNNSTSSGTTITTTNWSLGDGTSSMINNPIHTYGGAGVYKVVLSIASSQGCIGSDSANVVVNAVPTADFDFSKNICLGFPTNFYDSSTVSVGSVSTWNWSFGDGNTDTVKHPFNVYTAAGTYVVTLQATTDSGCSDVTTKNITINPEAVSNFTYTPVCLGDSISFKDISSVQIPDSIVAWYWDFGDGGISTMQNPIHQYSGNTQSYLVNLTVTTKYGCLKDTTILVSYLPVPVYNYGPQFFGYCEDDPVSFYDSSVIAAPATIVGWEWDFGNGHQSFVQNPIHIYDSAGSYSIKIKLTSSDGCIFYDSLPAPLIIYPKPIADFLTVPSIVSVFSPEVYFDNKSTGAVSYIWNFGDGSTGTDNSPTHMFPGVVGYYTTSLFAFSAFGCMDSTSRTIYVKDEFTLYVPNAFTPDKNINNTFFVKGYQLADFHMKIYNRWGELLFETKDETVGWDGKHNGKECKSGAYVYVIKVRDPSGNINSKTGHINLIR